METITNFKNAILGDGNSNTNSNTNNYSNTTQSEVHKSMIDDSVTETKFSGRTESDPDSEGSYQPEKRSTDRRPEGPISTGGQPQGANLTGEQGTNANTFSNSNEPNTGFGGSGAQPSVTADPSSGQQITPKHQGADRPNAEPETSSTFSGESGQSGQSGQPGGVGGSPGGMKLPESENTSKGEGTGTLYEKSTGLHAEGGDFDATVS